MFVILQGFTDRIQFFRDAVSDLLGYKVDLNMQGKHPEVRCLCSRGVVCARTSELSLQ
jgi:hypothetical protein